jgi:hypothetical protein
MPALDFPNAPTTGQTYPSPAIANTPVYQWDGTKWITHASSKTPVYTDGSNPMAAALTLSGDPVNPTDAADKSYVDSKAGMPSGSVMLFIMAAAPTGWTRLASYDDALLRLVGSATPGSGGSNGFVATFNAQTTVGATTLPIAAIPSHAHTLPGGDAGPVQVVNGSGVYCVQSNGAPNSSNTAANGGGGSHSHPLTTAIKYVDALVASKN